MNEGYELYANIEFKQSYNICKAQYRELIFQDYCFQFNSFK
jgi:hypothetical protein